MRLSPAASTTRCRVCPLWSAASLRAPIVSLHWHHAGCHTRVQASAGLASAHKHDGPCVRALRPCAAVAHACCVHCPAVLSSTASAACLLQASGPAHWPGRAGCLGLPRWWEWPAARSVQAGLAAELWTAHLQARPHTSPSCCQQQHPAQRASTTGLKCKRPCLGGTVPRMPRLCIQRHCCMACAHDPAQRVRVQCSRSPVTSDRALMCWD